MTLDLLNRHTALCLEGCNCSHCVWKVKENEILFNYRKLVPLQPGNCNCTKCLIVFSTVLYQSLHTSIEFWKQIFTYICTYMHNNRCHEYDILHIMTSFGIQPPGPSRCPFPLFLQAVLKVTGCKASVLLPNVQWVFQPKKLESLGYNWSWVSHLSAM